VSVSGGGEATRGQQKRKDRLHTAKPTQIFPLLEVVVELFPRGEVILGAVVAVESGLERGTRG